MGKRFVPPVGFDEDVISMRLNGFKVEDIRNYFKCRRSTIIEILSNCEETKDVKYKFKELYTDGSKKPERKKRKRSGSKQIYNHNYFEEINSQDKAYWLGFIYADGYIGLKHNEDGSIKYSNIEINLQRSDEIHLENLIKSIDGKNIKIYHRTQTLKVTDKMYDGSRLFIRGEKIVSDIIKYGCIPNKSLTLKFPKNVPDVFIPDFIRGYFDGDGTIVFNYDDQGHPKYNYRAIFLGTEDFLCGVKNFLNKYNIRTSRIYKDREQAKHYAINITGVQNLENMYRIVYKNMYPSLERKTEKFRNMIEYFPTMKRYKK